MHTGYQSSKVTFIASVLATSALTSAWKYTRRMENDELTLQCRTEAFPDLFLGCFGNTCFGLGGTILALVSKNRPFFIGP